MVNILEGREEMFRISKAQVGFKAWYRKKLCCCSQMRELRHTVMRSTIDLSTDPAKLRVAEMVYKTVMNIWFVLFVQSTKSRKSSIAH